MLEIASQMILCLLLAALIGAIIGYIFGKSTCSDNTCEEEVTSHDTDLPHTEETVTESPSQTQAIASTVATTVEPETTAPALLTGPRNGEKDNLTRIKGIGLKIDETLNSIGIYHFDQIADWTDDNITWADNSLGFPGRAKRENWVEQAKALATGEETEFSKRVDAGEVASSKKA